MRARAGIRVGVDIANEGDFARIWNKSAVLEKMFTRREIEVCARQEADSVAALTRRFAAKEAVIKACGKDISVAPQIEIVSDEEGRPKVKWDYLTEENLCADVSMTSESPLAVAVAIVQPSRVASQVAEAERCPPLTERGRRRKRREKR
jgi:phosphopantetheine--protein transferase-like protein